MKTKDLNKFLRPFGWLYLFCLIILFCIPPFMGSYFLHILIMCCFYAYLSQSWNILSGYAGQFSFGHAAFFGIGAYTSSLLFVNWGVSPWLGMFIGGIMSMFAGLFIGYLCFRYGMKGTYFGMTMLAFAEVLRLFTINNEFLRGSLGILIPLGESILNFQFIERLPYYYIILIMMLAITYITYKIENAHIGLYFVAIRENEEAAASLGVNVTIYKLIALAISSFSAALGGTFYAQYMYYIDPFLVFGISTTVDMILPSIIGGVGTVLGPIIGAFTLTPLSEVTRMTLGRYKGIHLMAYGAILVIMISFAPEGELGLIKKLLVKMRKLSK